MEVYLFIFYLFCSTLFGSCYRLAFQNYMSQTEALTQLLPVQVPDQSVFVVILLGTFQKSSWQEIQRQPIGHCSPNPLARVCSDSPSLPQHLPLTIEKVQFVAADKFHCGYSVIAAQRKPSCNNFSICRTGNQMFNLQIMLLAIKVQITFKGIVSTTE